MQLSTPSWGILYDSRYGISVAEVRDIELSTPSWGILYDSK